MHSSEENEECESWKSIPPEVESIFEALLGETLQNSERTWELSDKALPYIPIEITHIIFDNIVDMKGTVVMGMTCKSFYKRYRERFDGLIHTVDLRRLKYEHLKGFVQNINFQNIYEVRHYNEELHFGIFFDMYSIDQLRKYAVNDVYNGFLNKYMPKRMEGRVDMDFYDFRGWVGQDGRKLEKAINLLDRARELEAGKFVLRNSMDLVYFATPDTDVTELIVERVYDFLNYVEKEINSQL